MKVRDAMSTDIALVSPDETIQEAARAMMGRETAWPRVQPSLMH